MRNPKGSLNTAKTAGALSSAVAGGAVGFQFGGPLGAIGGAFLAAAGSIKNFDDELKNIKLEKLNEQINKSIEGFNAFTGKFKNEEDRNNFFSSIDEASKAPKEQLMQKSNGKIVRSTGLFTTEEVDLNKEQSQREKSSREIIEKSIRQIMTQNAGQGSNVILGKIKKSGLLDKLRETQEGFNGKGYIPPGMYKLGTESVKLAQSLEDEIKKTETLSEAFAENSLKMFDMANAVEESGNRMETASDLFHRNMSNMSFGRTGSWWTHCG